MNLEKNLKLFFLKIFLFLFKKKQRQQKPSIINRIIIIRQHDQLGDFLITTPTIRAIRKRFPMAYIAVVVKNYTKEMILNNPYVDEIIVYREKLKDWSFSWLYDFIRRLRKVNGFDLAIVLNTISRSITSDIIAVLSKAEFILSSDKHKLNYFENEPVYNLLSQSDVKIKTEIERNLDIVKTIGVKADGNYYDLYLTKEEIKEGKRIIKNLKIPKRKKIISLHFGTLDITRRYPLDKLAKLIDEIISKYNVAVISIIGKNEIQLREEFIKMLKNKIYLLPLVPIRISASIISESKLFICNDTGTLHIAAALKIPTVSFHSTNDPKIWKPPHARHIAIRAKDKLITSITHKQVMQKIHLALKNLKID